MSSGGARLPTLSNLLDVPQRLEIFCRMCPHAAVMSPEEAVATFGPDTTFAALERVLACAECGAKGRDRRVGVRGSIEDYYAAMDRAQHERNRILYGDEGADLMRSYRGRHLQP